MTSQHDGPETTDHKTLQVDTLKPEQIKLPETLEPLYLNGHVIDVLRQLPEKCVQTVCTSPPYLWLRDYSRCGCSAPPAPDAEESRGVKPPDPACPTCHGTGQIPGMERVWGGDPIHTHEWGVRISGDSRGGSGTPNGRNFPEMGYARADPKGRFCTCGAWFGMLGGEPTIALFVQHLVEVFREVRRVLRDDGTVFLNIGDSFNGNNGKPRTGHTLKSKDLCLVPERLVIALQDDGWVVRSDIIWDKPNGLPDSTDDRPTRNHEFIFMLTKLEHYFYDNNGERTPYVRLWDETNGGTLSSGRFPEKYGRTRNAGGAGPYPLPRAGYADSTLSEVSQGYDGEAVKNYDGTGAQDPSETKRRIIESIRKRQAAGVVSGSNLRTVWRFPTASFRGSHFAVFPPELPRRAILLGTSEYGQCAKCGAPWKRTSSRDEKKEVAPSELDRYDNPKVTSGWKPTCECFGKFVPKVEIDENGEEVICKVYRSDIPLDQQPVVPQLVMDIFAGSGTTLAVARQLGRRSIGIDLNGKYMELAQGRPGIVGADLTNTY